MTSYTNSNDCPFCNGTGMVEIPSEGTAVHMELCKHCGGKEYIDLFPHQEEPEWKNWYCNSFYATPFATLYVNGRYWTDLPDLEDIITDDGGYIPEYDPDYPTHYSGYYGNYDSVVEPEDDSDEEYN